MRRPWSRPSAPAAKRGSPREPHWSAGPPGRRARSPRTTPRTYALRGLIRCSLCDRKMQGTFNHGHPHYRCRYPYEYAKSGTLDHPLTVYIREAVILPKLDRWIAQVF
ncbi:zinc ribbon domain-containing protein, partial [Streptomyces violaceusniger]|uniref:zinc ribbon domain-containing protein n=1 Tax=Streptomyces violaceusniger TaxID=68280 RepID=UPI0038262592